MNVLLIDDEMAIVSIIQQTIDWKHIGIEKVYVAYNAIKARKIVESQQVEIIICDIEMPQESGLNFLSWVQKEHPEIISIILTGFPDFDYAKEAVAVGVFQYLLKPVRFEELQKVILDAETEARKKQKYQEMDKIAEYFHDHLREQVRNFYHDLAVGNIISESEAIHREIQGRMLDNVPLVFQYMVLFKGLNQNSNGGVMAGYALQNMAEELFPFVFDISTESGSILWTVQLEGINRSIEVVVKQFLDTVERLTGRKLAAYIADCSSLEKTKETAGKLCRMAEQCHIPGRNIYYLKDWIQEEALPDIIQNTRHYLEEHYSQKITRKDLEDRFHLNADYLNRQFKNMIGLSLMEYIQTCRIQNAKSFLKDTKLSIGEVGNLVGYPTPSYFTRIFKEVTGATPIEFRKKYQ